MAVPVQTNADKKAISLFAEETAEGVCMFPFFGDTLIGSGTGTPNAEVTAPKGSLFLEKGGPHLYMNTDGVKAWGKVGLQT